MYFITYNIIYIIIDFIMSSKKKRILLFDIEYWMSFHKILIILHICLHARI